MGNVLSFEASSSGQYGDILSRTGDGGGKLKVGFLGCGYFEYWRMFSPEFKQRVIGDLERIARETPPRLRRGLPRLR